MPAPSGGPAARLAQELVELGDASEVASTTDSEAAPLRAPLVGRWAKAALCAAGVAAACGLVTVGGAARGGQRPQHRLDARPEAVSLGALSALGDVLESAGNTLQAPADAEESLEKLPGQMQSVADELYGGSVNVTAHGPLVEALQNGTFDAWLQNESNREKLKRLLKKPNDLHDANFCEDDEEEHATLCYKKCSLITNGQYPFRGTAFSCCKATPCTLFNSHFIMQMCGGYDIAGERANGACPHSRGACYADEEYHLNSCYKKCILLTNGTHAFRSAAETCCTHPSVAQCMMDANSSVTSPLYAVGGGELENTNRSNRPHPPVLTEAEEP